MTLSLMLRYLATGSRSYGAHPVRPYRRGVWEFQAVVAGRIAPILADGSGTPQASHLWLFGPGCIHGWGSDVAEPAEVIVFHFAEVSEVVAATVGEERWCGLELRSSERDQLARLATGCAKHIARPNALSDLHHHRTLLELAWLVGCRLGLDRQDEPHRAERVIARALAWAAARLPDGADVGGMARAVHCSPAHLRRLFHAGRRCSPQSALAELRLQRARELLGEPATTLATIADQCGFASASALSRAFARRHGCAPQHWRQRRARHNRGRA